MANARCVFVGNIFFFTCRRTFPRTRFSDPSVFLGLLWELRSRGGVPCRWHLLVLPFRFLMGSCVWGLHARFSPGVLSWFVAATSEFWAFYFLPSRCDDCVFPVPVSRPLAGRFYRYLGWRSVPSRSYVGIRWSDYISPCFSVSGSYGHLGCCCFPA